MQWIDLLCTLFFFIIAGCLLGFINIREMNAHLARFERSCKEGGAEHQPLANSMPMLMVRGLYKLPSIPLPSVSLDQCSR